ncbi:hypothetical protein L0657_08315 [Dyadobacter sp. CY345]|uniref:alpha/beta fold hydrolase n=1 Tax=Dyadobacter sp. CY345 TaxID=2909335 RepID=UPI001F448355|nr:hypothetical protein [Dyadobacter sp. CY345]MCF2443955.1 hypothetical protein [Dyadobacter sp. CY345]
MMNALALAAQTNIELINDTKIAYRQFGTAEPLLLVNRFRGVMDTWNPLFLDALAADYQVILFDYSLLLLKNLLSVV